MPSGIFAPKHLNKPIKPDELREYQLPHLMTPTALNEPVYEFRHGTLIPGFILMDYRGDFLFVPEEGAKTIEAAPYLKTYAPSFRRIYNLPGKFVKEGPEKK